MRPFAPCFVGSSASPRVYLLRRVSIQWIAVCDVCGHRWIPESENRQAAHPRNVARRFGTRAVWTAGRGRQGSKPGAAAVAQQGRVSSPSDPGEGAFSRLDYGSLALRPVAVLALLPELTRRASSHRGRLHSGFRRFGHPLHRRLSLRWQLGNFHRRDSHPQEWQLASLHTKVVP